MDYFVYGLGVGLVVFAAAAFWVALKKYRIQQEKERKKAVAGHRRAAKAMKAAQANGIAQHPAHNEGMSNSNLYAGLNGTDKSLYGRGEHQ